MTSWAGADQVADRRRRLVRGQGAYIGDLLPPGTLHASFVRSYLPHAEITGIDVSGLPAGRGVFGAFTGRDLSALTPLRTEAPGLAGHDWHALPESRARYAGEPLAVVLAADPYAAEDAAESVVLELEPLPAVMTTAASLADGAPLVHEALGSNLLYETRRVGGDPDAAFAEAPVLVERTFRCARQTPLPLETRGVLAQVEPATGRLIVWTSTQIPHIVRTALAKALNRPEATVRIITPDVGGGFGLKAHVFAEEIAVAALAVQTGRPVRWVEDRRENLIASAHAHAQEIRVRLAAHRDGTLLAADVDVLVGVGAYSIYPFTASLEPGSTSGGVLGCYRVDNVRVAGVGVATNQCPIGAYRGVGGANAVFASERIMDVLAAELGMDRVALRMKNLVRPEAMPHRTALGAELDSGRYAVALETALQRADYQRLCEERAQPSAKVVGVGVCAFNELSAPGSAMYRRRGDAIPGYDSARITMDVDGTITVYVSSADAGQDHLQSYRLAAARVLGIPPSRIRVVEGDTELCPEGSGTFASRSGTAQLSAVADAAAALKSRLEEVAALALGTDVADLTQTEGGFEARGIGTSIGLDRLARVAHLRDGDFVPPAGFEPGLDVVRYVDPVPTYPYGAHIAVVEMDAETFQVRLRSYVAVEDCGVVINEPAVHEQVIGGIATGIGNALYEEIVYDDEGEIRTSSLLDYLVPLVGDVPPIDLHHLETPSDRTTLGTKGVAEAGTIGAMGAIGSAVNDALRQLGAECNDVPLTPQRLFDAVERAAGV